MLNTCIQECSFEWIRSKRKMSFISSPLVYEIETKFDQLWCVCEDKTANQWPLCRTSSHPRFSRCRSLVCLSVDGIPSTTRILFWKSIQKWPHKPPSDWWRRRRRRRKTRLAYFTENRNMSHKLKKSFAAPTWKIICWFDAWRLLLSSFWCQTATQRVDRCSRTLHSTSRSSVDHTAHNHQTHWRLFAAVPCTLNANAAKKEYIIIAAAIKIIRASDLGSEHIFDRMPFIHAAVASHISHAVNAA